MAVACCSISEAEIIDLLCIPKIPQLLCMDKGLLYQPNEPNTSKYCDSLSSSRCHCNLQSNARAENDESWIIHNDDNKNIFDRLNLWNSYNRSRVNVIQHDSTTVHRHSEIHQSRCSGRRTCCGQGWFQDSKHWHVAIAIQAYQFEHVWWTLMNQSVRLCFPLPRSAAKMDHCVTWLWQPVCLQ